MLPPKQARLSMAMVLLSMAIVWLSWDLVVGRSLGLLTEGICDCKWHIEFLQRLPSFAKLDQTLLQTLPHLGK